ncbi:MAG: polymer-forming cytoskeletal protein [Chitinophagaceae bacterium]
MFNNKEKTAVVSERPISNSNAATLISPGTTLNGNISSDHDLRIDGTVHGNIMSSSKIILGPTGFVEGNIEGACADVTGKVLGNITVSELLQLRGECNVQGNITASKVQVDPTATFNGQCQMGAQANIVQMNGVDAQAGAK